MQCASPICGHHHSLSLTPFHLILCWRLQRLAKDLLKQLQVQDSGSWANTKVSAVDRTLGEVARILEKEVRHSPQPRPLSLCLFLPLTGREVPRQRLVFVFLPSVQSPSALMDDFLLFLIKLNLFSVVLIEVTKIYSLGHGFLSHIFLHTNKMRLF